MVWLQFLISVTSLVLWTSCHDMYDVNIVPHECIKDRAIAANYTPLGQTIQIGNLPVYEFEAPNNQNKNRMLVGVYDVYGFAYDNIKQLIDEMAIQKSGFRAVLPDFYRGESSNPDFNATEREEWMDRVGDWDSVVKPDLINVLDHYEKQGVTEFAIFGFCWGGKVATLASIELSDKFKASGLIHPSSVTNDEAVDVKIPMYLMPSGSEADMIPFYEVLQTKFGDNCGHRRFDDMRHGFAGSRGNFSDPVVQERVNEVITTLGAFFDRNLNNSNDTGRLRSNHILLVTLITSFFLVAQS